MLFPSRAGISTSKSRRVLKKWRRAAQIAVEPLEERKVLSFTAPMNYPIDGGALALAVGDVNNDGRPDLVAPVGSNGLSVILGKGDGTFQPPLDSGSNPASGGMPWRVALGDFNGDGKLDAATSNLSGYLSVFQGNGDGTFRLVSSTFIGFDLRSVTAADLNGDGKLDLAAVSVGSEQKNPGTTVALLFGNGDGTFGAPTRWAVGNAPIDVTTGDFNGDGKTDLVTANYKDGTVSLLLGNGNGTFQGLRNFGVGTHPVSLAVRDLNGDGKADLAVGLAGGSIGLLLGKGDGSFSTGKKVDSSQSLNSITAADFNGDGKIDLVAGNNAANTMSVFLGNGDGTYRPATTYLTGNQPWFLVSADLNGDGRPDIATANVSGPDVSIFLNQGAGTFATLPTTAVGATPLAVAKGDFNGDGKLDLVTANAYSNNISVLLGLGNGSFQPAVSYAVGQRPASITVGDFNGDGKLDLAVGNSNLTGLTSMDTVSILLGNGDGTFQPAVSYSVGPDPTAIVTGDFNGDGKLDLATANDNFNNGGPGVPGGSTVSILLGNGDGTFQPAQNVDAGGAHPSSLAAADLNRDGRTDLVVASSNFGGTTNAVTVLLGNGGGSFQAPSTVLANAMGYSVVVGDFNGDGLVDIAATTSLGVDLLLGHGDGTFAPATSVSTATGGSLTAADLNGDGKLDLVLTSGFTVGVLLGSGTGTFSPTRYSLVGSSAWAAVVGDYNGDGIPDIAVADSVFGAPGSVSMLINDGKPF